MTTMTSMFRKTGRKATELARRLADSVRATLDPSVPIIAYYTHEPNWGDALNPVLVEHLSGRTPVVADELLHLPPGRAIYSVIGSILGNYDFPTLEVWGSGFIGEDRQFGTRPRRVHAVRGPLTRTLVLRQGIACPEVYGDPALLYPRFFRPTVTKSYDVGLVPHSLDRDSPWVRRMAETGHVRVLDVYSGVKEFVEDLCRCRSVASSSLHGIIAADAYGIPFTWIELSDRVKGRGFKFRDYFASTGRSTRAPVLVGADTGLAALVDAATDPGPDLDLERLLASCPFRSV